MSTFPYLPMVAIMMTLATDMVVQMNVLAYSGFMVEHLGVVDTTDKAGETPARIFRTAVCVSVCCGDGLFLACYEGRHRFAGDILCAEHSLGATYIRQGQTTINSTVWIKHC